jgi:hypothetical protein
MREVSNEAELLLMQLVAWEMLGQEDVNPKVLLRQVSLADLSAVQRNINARPETKEFVAVQMVELELLYRRGFLTEDWNYTRSDECVMIKFETGDQLSHPALRLATEARA